MHPHPIVTRHAGRRKGHRPHIRCTIAGVLYDTGQATLLARGRFPAATAGARVCLSLYRTPAGDHFTVERQRHAVAVAPATRAMARVLAGMLRAV